MKQTVLHTILDADEQAAWSAATRVLLLSFGLNPDCAVKVWQDPETGETAFTGYKATPDMLPARVDFDSLPERQRDEVMSAIRQALGDQRIRSRGRMFVMRRPDGYYGLLAQAAFVTAAASNELVMTLARVPGNDRGEWAVVHPETGELGEVIARETR